MTFSIIHPTRSRPKQSFDTISKWLKRASNPADVEVIAIIDESDPLKYEYFKLYGPGQIRLSKESTSVAAVNIGANVARGNIFVVIGDDQDVPTLWDTRILNYTKGKTDWVLKVRDGLQNKLITLPIMDRTYYNRDKFIYHPDFLHLWSDTFFSDLAYARKRVITKNVRFPHRQYSIIGTEPDEINLKNNATYESGKKTYLELKKNIAKYV